MVLRQVRPAPLSAKLSVVFLLASAGIFLYDHPFSLNGSEEDASLRAEGALPKNSGTEAASQGGRQLHVPPLSFESDEFTKETNRKLEFVHITKTGGTAIEAAAARANLNWGACHYITFPHEHGCQDPDLRGTRRIAQLSDRDKERGKTSSFAGVNWHVPPHWFAAKPFEEDAATFVVVRDPYDRVVSEYYCPWFGHQGKDRSRPEVMNDWIQEKLQRQDERSEHFLPQHYYVFDYADDGEAKKVVDHVLHYETLHDEFPKLMSAYGLTNVTLAERHTNSPHRAASEERLTRANLTSTTIRMINEEFMEDFERFGYKVEN